jgi:hypothetical protein
MWSSGKDPSHADAPSEPGRGIESWAATLAVLYLIYAPAIAVMAIVTSVNQRLTSSVHLVCAAAIAACIPVYLLLQAFRVRESARPQDGGHGTRHFTDAGSPWPASPPQSPGPGQARD